MEPITWFTIAGLLLKYSPEVVDFILQKLKGGGDVTPAEWEELKLLAQQTPRTQLLSALARAGVAEDDPKALALLALLPK